MVAEYPLNRFGEPEETVDTIAFLASDEASFVTGHGPSRRRRLLDELSGRGGVRVAVGYDDHERPWKSGMEGVSAVKNGLVIGR